MQVPGPLGGHNWQPMAFSPKTGLVYIPAKVTPRRLRRPDRTSSYMPGAWNIGQAAASARALGASRRPTRPRAWPKPGGRAGRLGPGAAEGALDRAPSRSSGTRGVLATAGGLVFQGARQRLRGL